MLFLAETPLKLFDSQILKSTFVMILTLSNKLIGPHSLPSSEYEVVTVTGERRGAGTNAKVFMTLFGKSGSSGKVHLTNTTKSMFDAGSSDTFRFKSNCVGPMTKLRIEHDNTGLGAGWYLERVRLGIVKHMGLLLIIKASYKVVMNFCMETTLQLSAIIFSQSLFTCLTS